MFPSRFLRITKITAFTHLILLLACPLTAGEPKGPLLGFSAQRTWSDQSGRFKIDANLSFADENEVKLLKPDGKIVAVPLNKLSKPDQTYIEGFLKAEAALSTLNSMDAETDANPFAGGEPAARDASASSSSMNDRSSGASSALPLPAYDGGPIPTREAVIKGARPLSITPAKPFWSVPTLRPFPEVQFEDVILESDVAKPFFASMRIMAAGRNGTVVLNAYQKGRGKDPDYARFSVANASSAESSNSQEFDQAWKLVAITPDGSRIAAVRVEGFDKGNDVAIFRITNGSVVPEFQFTAGGGSWDELQFASFLPNNRLLTISQKSNLTVWDLSNTAFAKALYRGSSNGTTTAELSPASEVVAMLMGRSIALVDTNSLKLVGAILCEDKPDQIAISPDGRTLATLRPFEVALYSMETGEQAKTIAVSESNGRASFAWIGENLKIGEVLYDIQRAVPVWTYTGRTTGQTTLGSYLLSAFGGDDGTTLAVLKVPHEEALRSVSDVDTADVHCIKPGDSIAVDFQLQSLPAATQQSIRQAVEQKIAALGWQLSSSASNRMTVKLEQGKQEEAEYYTRQGFGPVPFFPPAGFGPRPSGPSDKVNYTPWTHAITIQSNGSQVFQNQYVRSAPQGLTTKEGESTQAAVTRYCQPSPDYFKNVAIPPHLLKPEFQGGLGKSEISKTGLK